MIIPARDESRTIEGTIEALARQVDLTGQPLHPARYEIVLLVNNCRDDTAARARRAAARYPDVALHVVEATLPDAEAHVGRARQLLMDEAYRRLTLTGRHEGVIASTDGDTQVAPTWLAATLEEIARGADVVGGRITLDTRTRAALGKDTLLYYLRDAAYWRLATAYAARLDPDPYDPSPRHHQHFGASLAVTARAYRAAGGLPSVPALEDVALYHALRRVDARIRHSPDVRAVTSTRPIAQTRIGLTTQLGEWAALSRAREPWLVESRPSLAARLHAQRRLRALWRRARSGGRQRPVDVGGLAATLGLRETDLADALTVPRPFGALLEEVERRQVEEGVWTREVVEITAAIDDLRASLKGRRRDSVAALHPFEEIEPVVIHAPASQTPQAIAVAVARDKEVVDLVAG